MKVKFVQNQPHCFAFGGFEIQMLSTLKAVQDVGVDASRLDPWNRDNNFDIVHLWGLELSHSKVLQFAPKDGKKIIVTALFDSYETSYKKIRHFVSSKMYKARILKEMAALIDRVVVINELEAVIANKYFDVPYSKIAVIPIIVSDVFFAAQETKVPFLGLTDYVLCTGNICRRKNQLNLVRACNAARLKLVLIGKVLTGEERYGQLVEAEMDAKRMVWIKGVEGNSSELVSAYQNCAVFALPSVMENSPISVFEALASGCKVVLADRKYAYQSYFKNVNTVDPNSVNDIAAGLLKVIVDKQQSSSIGLINECKSRAVGARYKELYNSLFV